MSDPRDIWIVVLNEMREHVKMFANKNVMEFKDDEYIAFSVGLGMVDVLCKRMIEDIMENKNDRE
ncbi:MAG TPA: hypothetical protein DCM40_18230 [Maribacter sp.]|nr:hypothetical protein [Maribacter sp.]|tara:strand:- start:491 stop:685 length:195 start_codon:yes stop_codon:yes gene_type:complete